MSSSGSGALTLSCPCCRLLEEESAKRAELEKWHLEQQQAIQTTEAEKQELENQRVIKEQALQAALEQLQRLELERKQALEQYEVIAPVPADALKLARLRTGISLCRKKLCEAVA